MTSVEVNGTLHTLAAGTTISALLDQLAGSRRGSAVVVDDEVVPRSRWDDEVLLEGQRVELITAVQGG